jgi:hypothetical protein
MPTVIQGQTKPDRISLMDAIPVDATLINAAYVTRQPRQLIVTWQRVHSTRDRQAAVWQRLGVAIWQLDPGRSSTWHRVYTHEEPFTNETNIHGYDISLGDMSGDGRPEVLIAADRGGSGGGYSYDLLANRGLQLYRPFTKELPLDEGTVTFGRRSLIIKEGVDPDFHGAHCCFRRVRETWLRWDEAERRLVVVHRQVRNNVRRWPPG